MAKEPSFNFGANVKPKKSKPKKSGGKGKKKLTMAQRGSIDFSNFKIEN